LVAFRAGYKEAIKCFEEEEHGGDIVFFEEEAHLGHKVFMLLSSFSEGLS